VKRFGFRTRLFLAFSLLIAGIAAFFSVYFPSRLSTSADAALKTRAIGLATVLANLVATSVEFDQQKDAETQLASVREDADLRYVLVLKNDNSVFARYRSKELHEGQEVIRQVDEVQTTLQDDMLHVHVPLRRGNSDVGTLAAGFSRKSVVAERSSTLRAALLVSAIVIVVGMLIAYTMTKPLVRVASELLSAAREQETSMAQGASAVAETRRTIEMLVASAQKIAESCSAVLGNAESTYNGMRHITDCINELNIHAEKVAEILAAIMQVADRTDLLALNAALEGTKAGDAGKGFTLVAGEMRRLAENVMESVNAIRALMKDVRTASQKAVQASHDGTNLSEETTNSAREIALVTQQQRTATEQVRISMDEMTQLLNHTMSNINQTTREAVALAGFTVGDSGMAPSRVMEQGEDVPLPPGIESAGAKGAGNGAAQAGPR
jgi:methyl-accepting chemotaxis protein